MGASNWRPNTGDRDASLMTLHEIDSLDHPLLEPFVGIRTRNWTELSGIFIAEGPCVVQVLLHSDYQVKSVLLDRKYFDHYASMIPENVAVILVNHEFVHEILGYDFHRGILACGSRKPIGSVRADLSLPSNQHETLVAAVGVQDPENLGGILRSCAALGIQRVIVGPGTADPLARRVLRVSMGTVLNLQLFRSRDMLADLKWLQTQRQIESLACSLQSGSEPLETCKRHGPTLILVGNERYGLADELQAATNRRVTIPMELATDSLNVSVAAGIILHYFCRIAEQT